MMTDQMRSSLEIQQAIHASAGMRFINREHGRSFSLNIFRTNARELIEALRHVSDPEHGLHLMALDNREAGTQAHREVSRRIHNFVAAAKTLVDHTRVFMKKHYDQTSIWSAYNEEVTNRFSKNPVAKFVHDLRNYMLHCGLPNSSMFVRFSQNPEEPDQPSQILTTGVGLGTEELKGWDGWTSPARAYLDSVGEEVPIELLVRTYTSQVEEFQTWIEAQLLEFHTDDIANLDLLYEEYASSESKLNESSNPAKNDDAVAPNGNLASIQFILPPSTATEIDRIGNDLVSRIRQLDIEPIEQNFSTERPVQTTITADNLVKQPIFSGGDAEGNQVFAFILNESGIYGFDSRAIFEFRKIVELVLDVSWARHRLSEKFVQDAIVDWCRDSFNSVTETKLTEAITCASRMKVKHLEIWAPIAHLEVESGFSFGPVKIMPITSEMINRLEANGLKTAPNQEPDVRALFDRLRSSMQGYAAVVVSLEAVSERASAEGIAIAREAVNLLRFFSPAASKASILSPTSLLGSEVVPASHVLVLGDDSFSYSEAIIPTRVAYWRMSNSRLLELQEALEATGALILTEHLGEFEIAVRSGMILFGTAATFGELSDRLIYTLSSMEGVLLKHELEAAAYSVEQRMTQLLATDDMQRDEIGRNIRAIYRLRARHGSLQWSDFDRHVLEKFVRYVERVLLIALQNIHSFSTRAQFIEALERSARN